MVQTLNALAEQKVSCSIQRVSKEQVEHVHFWCLLNLLHENLHMLFENMNIAQTVLDKLRTDQLAGIMPKLTVCGEDSCSRDQR